MNANQLRDVAALYFASKNYAVHFEMGLNSGGSLRADVLALNMQCELIIAEVKSSIADYKSDKKWHNYKLYSDKFYFVFYVDVYEKLKLSNSLPKDCGILVVSSNKDIACKQKVKHELISDNDIRFNLIVRMAYRSADKNRYKVKSKFNNNQ
jgi:hypothetical protein